MLFMKQIYFNRPAQSGNTNTKIQLNLINLEIKAWVTEEAESILLHINMQEINDSEDVNLYHHKIHKISELIFENVCIG